MLLSINVNDIQKYMNTSNRLMHCRYIIKLKEYENNIIKKDSLHSNM